MQKAVKAIGIMAVVIVVIIAGLALMWFMFLSINDKIMKEVEEKNRQETEQSRQVTVDGKYEYFFYLVGRLTDSPRAHIAVRDLNNNDEKFIIIGLNFEGIGAVEKLSSSIRLVEISPTDKEHIYRLTTTPQLKDEIETFEVNMETETAKKMK